MKDQYPYATPEERAASRKSRMRYADAGQITRTVQPMAGVSRYEICLPNQILDALDARVDKLNRGKFRKAHNRRTFILDLLASELMPEIIAAMNAKDGQLPLL